MSAEDEQRATPRHDLTVEVKFESRHEFYAGVTLDFSTGGIFLATPALRPIGDCLRVRFTLPDIAEPFDAIAEVRWLRAEETEDGPVGMGLQFLQLSPRAKLAVQAFRERREAARRSGSDNSGSDNSGSGSDR